MGETTSVPEVALVVLDAMFLQESSELLLEGGLAVVLLLPGDVGPHRLDVGLTDGKGAVAVLPVEVGERASLGLDPLGRALLDLLHDLDEGAALREREQ